MAARTLVTPDRFRAEPRRPHAPDAGLSLKRTRANTGIGKSPRARTTTRTTSRARRTVALPAADTGGAGRIADQGGTGWRALALRGTWRPRAPTAHTRRFRRISSTTTDCGPWCRTRPTGSAAPPTSRFSAFRGKTELLSVYAQDTWHFAGDWRATLGVRVRALAGRGRRDRQRDEHADLCRAQRDLCRRPRPRSPGN